MPREDIITTRRTFTVLAGLAAILLAAAGVSMYFCFRYYDIDTGVFSFFAFQATFGLGFAAIISIRNAAQRNADVRVLTAIDSFAWEPAWAERKYTEELTRHLLASVDDARHQVPAHEARTEFDIIVKYRGEDWLITAKKGLDNQKRLTLQGEIEDFIARWDVKGGRRLHVVVVLGFDDKAMRDLSTQEQKKTLIGHLELRRREIEDRRHRKPGRKWRVLEYDVCTVPIAATQVADTALAGTTAIRLRRVDVE